MKSRSFNDALSNLEGKQIPIEAVNYLKTLSRHPLLIEASKANKRRMEQKKAGEEKRKVNGVEWKDKRSGQHHALDSLIDDLGGLSIKKKCAPKVSRSSDEDEDDDDFVGKGPGGCDDSTMQQKSRSRSWAKKALNRPNIIKATPTDNATFDAG